MKAKRQALIREIVESQSIQTQEELAEALRAHGMVVTQATVSRDIKEMHLLKVLAEDGNYRQAHPHACRFVGGYQQGKQFDRHQNAFRQRARRGGSGGQPALAGGAGHDCGR